MDRLKKIIRQNLHEIRGGFIEYLKYNLPGWPEYVVKDFVYQTLKGGNPLQIEEFFDEYKNVTWSLEKNFMVTMEMFHPTTQEILKSREGGKSYEHYNIPRDEERHNKQRELMFKRGLSKEPLIMFLTQDGKYELVEGWHRTIQAFKYNPEGFEYPFVFIGKL